MPEKDYNKQIARRESIKRTALVVGMDIGCEFNAMCLMNKDGEVLGRYPKIYNSRQRFNYFYKTIEEMKVRKDFKEVIIGLEPTGHYWRKIAYFAKDKDYEVRFVSTTALKHQRELDESSSAKNDIKDAITIANITRKGKYIDTAIEDDIFRQLRTLSHVRERSLSCAVFWGELGNPSNFRRPKQTIKYAGYDPKENDSGKKIGRKIISKKGRWLLRKCLYFMSMRAINRSAFFKEYYQRKISNNNSFGQPLRRNEALCAVVIKLVKVIFALLRDNRTFTAEAPVSILAA